MALLTPQEVMKALQDAVTQINTILADFNSRIEALEAAKTTSKAKS